MGVLGEVANDTETFTNNLSVYERLLKTMQSKSTSSATVCRLSDRRQQAAVLLDVNRQHFVALPTNW